MPQSIVHIALVVRDYDEAIEFYIKKLGFELIEDTYQAEQSKRWVVVSPAGCAGTTLLLAKASRPEQEPFIGNQAGGRVFLFLNSDDFWRDYRDMVSKGIKFVREPKEQVYGMVAVFEDLYGNLWDLLQLNVEHPILKRDTAVDAVNEKIVSGVNIKLEHFLHDLVWLIKEGYNEGLDRVAEAETDTAKAFAGGESFAYRHVLETIERQLSAFGAADEMIDGIAPEPGQKAECKKAKF